MTTTEVAYLLRDLTRDLLLAGRLWRKMAREAAARHGVSEATIYNWKAKYGGLDVSDVRRLRSLEDENAKLKKLLADSMLDNAALKDLLSKKW